MHWFTNSALIVFSMICVSCFDLSSKTGKKNTDLNINPTDKTIAEERKKNTEKDLYTLFKPVTLKPVEEKKLEVNIKPSDVNTIKTPILPDTIKVIKNETYKPFDVTLSPKKVDKFLFIKKNTPKKLNYEITDHTGRLIFEGEIRPNKNKLNMEDIKHGVYFFHVIFPDTNIKKAYRFVVGS